MTSMEQHFIVLLLTNDFEVPSCNRAAMRTPSPFERGDIAHCPSLLWWLSSQPLLPWPSRPRTPGENNFVCTSASLNDHGGKMYECCM